MSTDKEMSDVDKVTQAAEIQEAKGKEDHNTESTEESAEVDRDITEIEEEVVYANLSKDELLIALKKLLSSIDFMKADHKVNEIKTYFDELYNSEKNEALDKFVNEGGVVDDFNFKKSDADQEFLALSHDFKVKKTEFFKDQEKQIDRNLSWVARQIGTDRSNVAYWIKSKTIIGAEPLAKVLNVDPKDLIK
jgi:hypothetical protein